METSVMELDERSLLSSPVDDNDHEEKSDDGDAHRKRSRTGVPLLRTDLSPSPPPSSRNESPLSPFFRDRQRRPSIAAPAPAWRELSCDGPSPPPMSGLTCSYHDRTMYVFGGYASGNALDGLFALDLDALTWRRIEPVGASPTARTSHSAVVDDAGARLYIGCGSGAQFGHSNMNDFYEFDISFSVWRRLEFTGDELRPRYGQSIIWYDRKLFVFGGTFGREFSQELFILDLVAGVCHLIPPDATTPTARYKHAACRFDHNKMLVFGGAERQNYKLNDVAYLNLDSLRWTTLDCSGAKPGGRFAHSMCVASGKAFVFGGTDRESCQSDLYILDIAGRHWTKLVAPGGSVPRGRYFHGSVFDAGRGDLFIWGGKGSTDAQIRFGDLHAIALEAEATTSANTCTVGDDLAALLTSASMSDLQVIAVDGTAFSAHQIIVRSRCAPLTDLINFDAGPNQSAAAPRLHLRHHNADVVERLLWYLYADDIVHAGNDGDVCLRLMICGARLEIPRLVALCERRVRRAMTIDRAQHCQAAIQADDMDSPLLEPFRRFLERFLHVHHCQGGTDQLVGETDRYEDVPNAVPPSTLAADLGRLRSWTSKQAEVESFPFDIRFQCGDELDRLGAHQAIISARSKYFGCYSFLEGMREARTRVCTFPSRGDGVLSKEAFIALLDYLYGGEELMEPRLTPAVAHDLLANDTCNYFGLSSMHLHQILQQYLSQVHEEEAPMSSSRSDGASTTKKQSAICMLS